MFPIELLCLEHASRQRGDLGGNAVEDFVLRIPQVKCGLRPLKHIDDLPGVARGVSFGNRQCAPEGGQNSSQRGHGARRMGATRAPLPPLASPRLHFF